MHGAQNAHMAAAAAQIGFEPGANLGVAGMRISLQQRLRPHHHAGNAVTALRRLRLDEGLLDRRGLVLRAEPFERRDLLAGEQYDRRHAGKDRLAIDQHRAGAALAESAAEFGGVELELAAQHVKQRRAWIGIHVMLGIIHVELHVSSLAAWRWKRSRWPARRWLAACAKPRARRQYWCRCRSKLAWR